MAFSLYDTLGDKVLNDTRYIQWIPTLSQKVDGKIDKPYIAYHPCTSAELASFNPVASLYEQDLEVWTERGLFCFDELPEGASIGGLQDG